MRARKTTSKIASKAASKLNRYQSTADSWIEARTLGRFFRALKREIEEDDVFGMAAEMAYRFLFAIFPLVLFLVASLGFVGDALGLDNLYDRVIAQARPFLPEQVTEVIDRYVNGLLTSRSKAFLTVGLLGTLWGAAGGVGTLIKGLNRAYDVERPRPFWRRQAIALLVTFLLPITALTLLATAVAGRYLVVSLGDQVGLGHWAIEAIAWSRWPVLVLLLFGAYTLIYHYLPYYPSRYRHSLPGSVFATVGWLLLTQGFSLYVSNFGNYDKTYGSFGAIIAFLMWLYLVGVVVLVGAEINTLLEPHTRAKWNARRGGGETG
ncbi:MAG: YihY/virulence factor BrkB family protein [Chloroflexota bacterium]|jgi:membrane protein